MQKQEKFLLEGHRSTFLGPKHKSAIWDRTPPTYTSNLVYMCAGGFRGQKSSNRIELSQFVQKLLLFFQFGFSRLWGGGAGGWGCPGWSTIVYMSSEMFRGKDSLNRIELSRLVQDLLNFGVLGSLLPWGGGRWVEGCLGASGGMGVVTTCTHMHVHACTCTHTHVYMYRNYKWPPTRRHPCLACLTCFTCMCMRACVHAHVYACMCAWDTPPHTHT